MKWIHFITLQMFSLVLIYLNIQLRIIINCKDNKKVYLKKEEKKNKKKNEI